MRCWHTIRAARLEEEPTLKEHVDPEATAKVEELELECELPRGHEGPHRARTQDGEPLWFPQRGAVP